MGKDWIEWHAAYEDPGSSLSARLQVVRQTLHRLLTRGPKRLVSVCAGRGEDVLPVLAANPSFSSIETFLVENHPQLAGLARDRAAALGLRNVTVLERDAGELSSYVDLGRADILMLCGLFGNMSDGDIGATVDVTPQLMSECGHLIWTRSRRAPDITPEIRRRLEETGFVEIDFFAPNDDLWSVGVNRFEGDVKELDESGTMFTFIV